ncbi:hypothetical protein B7494_g2120 [Chlorociboria aeruginascens]|nr:hypothetical protein B7494_g2120 [Chlorociboria aeruginascens]
MPPPHFTRGTAVLPTKDTGHNTRERMAVPNAEIARQIRETTLIANDPHLSAEFVPENTPVLEQNPNGISKPRTSLLAFSSLLEAEKRHAGRPRRSSPETSTVLQPLLTAFFAQNGRPRPYNYSGKPRDCNGVQLTLLDSQSLRWNKPDSISIKRTLPPVLQIDRLKNYAMNWAVIIQWRYEKVQSQLQRPNLEKSEVVIIALAAIRVQWNSKKKRRQYLGRKENE